jgi:leader peptidase (prepilin peptidase)/N-methyltransferase
VLACGLIIISFIDIEHRVIPDEISIGGIVVGLIFALIKTFYLIPKTYHLTPILDSLLGVLLGGGIIYLTGVVGNITLKKESMGGGDVKLLAMIGSFLGWRKTVLTFFIAPLFGLIPGIILKIKKQDLIPYGPFLSLGAIVSILWGEKILGWLF